MLKRLKTFQVLTIIGIILFSYNISLSADNKSVDTVIKDNLTDNKSEKNFNEDYFVGLKAYDDGFYDTARISLQDFLKIDDQSERAGFAIYVLYQIFMVEKDYKNAQIEFNKLDNFKDDRFDTAKIDRDKMFITSKLDCSKGEDLLLTAVNNIWIQSYLDAGCTVTENIVSHVVKSNFNSEALYVILENIKDNKKLTLQLYKELPEDKKTAKIQNYYGHYFAFNKLMPEFWALYNVYKDSDMVAIALDDIWSQSDFPKYINTFASDVKEKYKLPNVAYCRMIEASNKNGDRFDCSIVDGCLSQKSPDFTKSKLACLMRNEDIKGIDIFMKDVTNKDAQSLCEYGKYIIGKNLYSIGFVDKFYGCPDKNLVYDSFLKAGDTKAIVKFAGKNRSQQDIAYLAIAYNMEGKDSDAKILVEQIKEPVLLEMVKSKIGILK